MNCIFLIKRFFGPLSFSLESFSTQTQTKKTKNKNKFTLIPDQPSSFPKPLAHLAPVSR